MEFLKNMNAKALSKNQLKTIVGGASYSCRCANGSKSWTKDYNSDLSAAIDATNQCGGAVAYCDTVSGSLAGGPAPGPGGNIQ